jgi:homoaconitate hydratase family protein/3-isopropylmalate dehydratase small subunit
MPRTFVEKIFGSPAGSILFARPDIVLSHDNSASIRKTFEKMGGTKIWDPDRLLIVLDHNAPPTSAKLANDYRFIREFANEQGVHKFYDAGRGICHQIMSLHARPGMLIAGSDSHTCTAGAFNAMAVGIDRTETAGLWKRGETWFRVPESMKIILDGRLREGVYAKDLSLWIIGLIGSAGASYRSIEFHGEGVKSLGMDERMTLANLASEMGAKNAVFPADEVLKAYFHDKALSGIWADPDAIYAEEITIDLAEVVPLLAAPHHVDNIKPLSDLEGTGVNQGLIGTCTNGRMEDLRIAAGILKGKKIKDGFQLHITPASQEIYLQALEEGLIATFIRAGANVLSASCGPCLGTGQGIPADGDNVISTANRNFKGRMGNPEASIYLASPAAVAMSAIQGRITAHLSHRGSGPERIMASVPGITGIPEGESRRINGVWNYADAHNLNTDQMFAGNLTYNVLSSDPEAIMPHLFAGFDPAFAGSVKQGDIIIAGENFGCGSSREHPAVGLAHAGIIAIIVKSVNRIFFRSCINQGLLLIVQRDVVEAYKPGDNVELKLQEGIIRLNRKEYSFPPLPEKLTDIIRKKGLVNWIREA